MAHLQYRDGDWYLHASMRKVEDDETSESESKHRTVLSVDLGINNIAVTSTGQFWSADEFNHWRREYENRRGSLQQCGLAMLTRTSSALDGKSMDALRSTCTR
jgi:putative transposase